MVRSTCLASPVPPVRNLKATPKLHAALYPPACQQFSSEVFLELICPGASVR